MYTEEKWRALVDEQERNRNARMERLFPGINDDNHLVEKPNLAALAITAVFAFGGTLAVAAAAIIAILS